jgi:hypothetical protein
MVPSAHQEDGSSGRVEQGRETGPLRPGSRAARSPGSTVTAPSRWHSLTHGHRRGAAHRWYSRVGESSVGWETSVQLSRMAPGEAGRMGLPMSY